MDVHMNCVDLYILSSLVLFYSYLKASKMSRQVSYEMEKYGNNFLIIKCSQIYIIMDLLQYQFNNQNTMFVPDVLDHTGSRFCGQNERQIEHNSELAIFRRKILMVIKKKGTYLFVLTTETQSTTKLKTNIRRSKREIQHFQDFGQYG